MCHAGWSRRILGPRLTVRSARARSCSRKLFAAMGADVVKVDPLRGDPARRHPPFPSDVPHIEKSGLFLYDNMGKRSVTLDLARLVRKADVMMDNHPPGWMAARGFDYEDCRAINPRLVHLHDGWRRRSTVPQSGPDGEGAGRADGG